MQKILISFIALFLGACSFFGETPPEQFASAEIAITEGYRLTGDLLADDTITADTAKDILLAIDLADNALKTAENLYRQNDPGFQKYLNEAIRAILTFQSNIKDHKSNVKFSLDKRNSLAYRNYRIGNAVIGSQGFDRSGIMGIDRRGRHRTEYPTQSFA